MPVNLGHHRRRTGPPADHRSPSRRVDDEWWRILRSMAKTGLVSLEKSKIGSNVYYANNDDTSETDGESFHFGGQAQPRRPNRFEKNPTKSKKHNRKPSQNVKKDEDDDEYIKKRPATGLGLPWMFNLIGPPGIIDSSVYPNPPILFLVLLFKLNRLRMKMNVQARLGKMAEMD